MRGAHCLKTWASTQKNITLSSGEAELVAIVKMSTEIIGMTQLGEEWGLALKGSVKTDSSAALQVTRRKGNGRLRHIRIGMLWIQEKNEAGAITFEKVRGLENPADAMTKHVPANTLNIHMQALAQSFADGRASVTPALVE